jgi:hypothetical protein
VKTKSPTRLTLNKETLQSLKVKTRLKAGLISSGSQTSNCAGLCECRGAARL